MIARQGGLLPGAFPENQLVDEFHQFRVTACFLGPGAIFAINHGFRCPRDTVSSRRVRSGTHFLVDVIAGTVNPLWPVLEQKIAGPGGCLWIYVAWTIATSFSQLVGVAGADRLSLRWMIWAGPAVALVCLSCIERRSAQVD